MLVSKVPGIENDLVRVREIAPSGFVLALNLGWVGPEFLHSEYPLTWREIYEDRNYFMADPVFFWTLNNTGFKRWSEVGYPDPRGIAKKAKEHGLCYGAVFAEKIGRKKSFFSAGRADREFSVGEVHELQAFFKGWLKVVAERPELSLGQIQVLKCLRDGMSSSQIAAELEVSESTVKQRCQAVMKKFNASTRHEAVAIAVEKRYLTLD